MARYTSLSHLGLTLRSDPGITRALLSVLAGEIIASSVGQNNVGGGGGPVASTIAPPFRYPRLTPFRLAMGLSMALSVPRMRSSTLGTISGIGGGDDAYPARIGSEQ